MRCTSVSGCGLIPGGRGLILLGGWSHDGGRVGCYTQEEVGVHPVQMFLQSNVIVFGKNKYCMSKSLLKQEKIFSL